MDDAQNGLVFLKLGGSLITQKDKPNTPRLDVIRQAIHEIKVALEKSPGLQLVIGHGSGSYGHTAAHQFKTREGVFDSDGWKGFFHVWQAARELNLIVTEECHRAGLPVMPFPLATAATSSGKNIIQWNTEPISAALRQDLIPLVYGDVVFDRAIGATIFSTEEIFMYLIPIFQPKKILLAGIEPGIWREYPEQESIIPEITPRNLPDISRFLGGARATDVTGGMLSKVESMVSIVTRYPDIEIQIFTGLAEGNITKAILGETVGTVINKGN